MLICHKTQPTNRLFLFLLFRLPSPPPLFPLLLLQRFSLFNFVIFSSSSSCSFLYLLLFHFRHFPPPHSFLFSHLFTHFTSFFLTHPPSLFISSFWCSNFFWIFLASHCFPDQSIKNSSIFHYYFLSHFPSWIVNVIPERPNHSFHRNSFQTMRRPQKLIAEKLHFSPFFSRVWLSITKQWGRWGRRDYRRDDLLIFFKKTSFFFFVLFFITSFFDQRTSNKMWTLLFSDTNLP